VLKACTVIIIVNLLGKHCFKSILFNPMIIIQIIMRELFTQIWAFLLME